jgi:hypothetical protein
MTHRRHHFAWFAVLLPLVGGVPHAAADSALVTRLVSVADYRMRMVWGSSVEPSVTLAQRRGGSLQRYKWDLNGPHGLGVTDDLSSGHLRARFGVGGYVDMRFEASESASRGAVPLCGRQTRSVGWLVGTLRFPPGAGRFGTVVRHRLRAWLARGDPIGCYPAWDPGDRPEGWNGPPMLSLDGPAFGCPSGCYLRVENDGKGTVQWFERSRSRRLVHTVVARSVGRRFLWHTKNYSDARVVGIGPYFAGTLKYAASGETAPDGTFMEGLVRGKLQVKLAVPRTVTISSAPASLTTWSP